MNTASHAPRRARHVRVPAFAPVAVRARVDGWTPARQAAFLGALAETGSVEAAARKVGMARETAYRLRRRPGAGSFAAAWDAVIGKRSGAKRKVTVDERVQRAFQGLLEVRMYGGRHVATEHKADNRALLAQLAHVRRSARGRGGGGQS